MLTVSRSNLIGKVTPPSSKSVTHRAYIISSIVGEGCKITNPLISEDTDATLEILKKMGMKYKESNGVKIISNKIEHGAGFADCKNSGTSMRLLTAVAACFKGQTTFTGDSSLVRRPIAELVDALRELGADIETSNGFPPVKIKKPVKEIRKCMLDASKSSQFLSALLILGSMRKIGIEVELIESLPSRPYVDLTVQMLQEAGAKLTINDNIYSVDHPASKPVSFNVPADFSSAAFFVVAGALRGNSISIENIDYSYPQADAAIVDIVKQFGADVKENGDNLLVKFKELKGQDIDLKDSPDLFPILSVLAGLSDGESNLYGASHLKYKETNRIKTTGELISNIGGKFKETKEGAVIQGVSQYSGNATVNSYGDHRIAMAAAIAGTQSILPIKIMGYEAVSVSYRNFFKDLKTLGGNVKEEKK